MPSETDPPASEQTLRVPHDLQAGEERSALPLHGSTRLWAAGAVLTVALVVVATLAGHAVALRGRAGAETVRAPRAPLLPVVALAPLAGNARLLAVDPGTGRSLVVTVPAVGPCPAGVRCKEVASGPALEVVDDATGQIVSQRPVAAGEGVTNARWLLLDPGTHVAYAVADRGVTLLDSRTGAQLGTYALPTTATAGSSGSLAGAALDRSGQLWIASQRDVLALDPRSGQVLAQQALPAAAGVTLGLALDITRQVLYVSAQPSGKAPQLLVYRTAPLQLAADYALPVRARLGPVDPTGRLVVYERGGVVARFDPAEPTAAGPGVLPVRLLPAPELRGARDLSWDGAQNRFYAVTASGLAMGDMVSGRTLAAVALPSDSVDPWGVDATHGMVLLSARPAALVICRDAPGASSTTAQRVPSASQALLLARAALIRLLPAPAQNPPFVAADDFPLAAAARAMGLWEDLSDLGWLGPYSGTASTQVSPWAGHTGGYTVTFTLAWNQLFMRQHVWICTVGADGTVRLAGERGDAVS
jgi:hypothetical protein